MKNILGKRVKNLSLFVVFIALCTGGGLMFVKANGKDLTQTIEGDNPFGSLSALITPMRSPDPMLSEPISRTNAVKAAPSLPAPSGAFLEQKQDNLEARLATAEERIALMLVEAKAAQNNALRAERLLIITAVRRKIERGEALGDLAVKLSDDFGPTMPDTVDSLLKASEHPIRLDQLAARMEGLSPDLASKGQEFSLKMIERELSNLFTLRRESTPSRRPQRKLWRASALISAGRVEDAVAEVKSLPNADEAAEWIEDAERYVMMQDALSRLESTVMGS